MKDVIKHWWKYELKSSQRKGTKCLLWVLAFLVVTILVAPQVGVPLFFIFGGIAAFIALIIGIVELVN